MPKCRSFDGDVGGAGERRGGKMKVKESGGGWIKVGTVGGSLDLARPPKQLG
jgi:hypothetical protein